MAREQRAQQGAQHAGFTWCEMLLLLHGYRWKLLKAMASKCFISASLHSPNWIDILPSFTTLYAPFQDTARPLLALLPERRAPVTECHGPNITTSVK